MNKKTVFLIPGLLAAPLALAQQLSFREMLQSAGIAILPIVGLSILSLAVTIERLRRCRRDAIVPHGLVEQLVPDVRQADYSTAQRRLEEDTSVLGRVLLHAVTHRHRGEKTVSEAAGDMASIALREHLQRIYPLAVTATVAPIIGLLGTVVGMIESFHAIAFSGAMGDPAVLAGGISKALVNTAAGLSVALPALLVYHFFKNRIAAYGLELEKAVNRALAELFLAPDTDNLHDSLRNPEAKAAAHAY